MTLAASAGDGFVVTFFAAALARTAGVLTTGGTLAGFAVGIAVAGAFGLPGLGVLGTFFLAGTVATRIGWRTKKARGTAEANEGRRDARRVVGKGGVAGAAALLAALSADVLGPCPELVFAGAVAAALADTLATEIGTLWTGRVLLVPSFRVVPAGSPGGMSLLGTGGAVAGAAIVAAVAAHAGLVAFSDDPAKSAAQEAIVLAGLTLAGFGGAFTESFAVGAGLRAPGFVRNLLATGAGAVIARSIEVAR